MPVSATAFPSRNERVLFGGGLLLVFVLFVARFTLPVSTSARDLLADVMHLLVLLLFAALLVTARRARSRGGRTRAVQTDSD